MNRQEILKFIVDNNDNEHLLDFYNKTYEKLKEINKRIDKLTAYLIIVVFVFFNYFQIKHTIISSWTNLDK